MRTSDKQLRPFVDFTPAVIDEMTQTNSMVQLGVILGESPMRLKMAREGVWRFSIGMIIKLLNRNLTTETFLSQFGVTKEDFQMDGIRTKKVSLDYYVYRKVLTNARPDLFPLLHAELQTKTDESFKTHNNNSLPKKKVAAADEGPMELVAFMGSGSDRGIRWISRKKLQRLITTSPDAEFRVITDVTPDWLVQMFKDIEKYYFPKQEQISLPLDGERQPDKEKS